MLEAGEYRGGERAGEWAESGEAYEVLGEWTAHPATLFVD